jgi:outer membrane protein insertion porin family
MFLRLLFLQFAICILHVVAPPPALAQDLIGQPVADIVVEQEGQRVTDPLVLGLVQTRPGQPLSMVDVRSTYDHLYSLRRFDDIQTSAEPVAGGVRLRYVLLPSHPIDRIEFRGNVVLSVSDLQRRVTDRFGRSPSAARAADAAVMLRNEYRRRGYPAARIAARVEATHDPHRATLVFDVDAGRQARIAEVQFRRAEDVDAGAGALPLPEIRTGAPYDKDKIEEELARWVEKMRAQGFYEARATESANMIDDVAYPTVSLRRGPRVLVEFTGDPLPEKERDRMVPIRTTGLVSEDLLEDAKLAIEQYWRIRGHRDAKAEYSTDDTTPGVRKITFHITRGPHYTVDSVRITGNTGISTAELQKIITVAAGQEFIGATLETQAAAVEAEYRTRGFTAARAMPDTAVLPPESPGSSERRVEVIVSIEEGPRTTIRSIAFTGNMVFTESQLRDSTLVRIGGPFLARDVVDGRDRVVIRYRNQGYLNVAVRPETMFAENSTQADITYSVTEGPQAIIGHIIITGNDKTKTRTILDELEIHEGEPLGENARENSRIKLNRLGLFRRITIEPVANPGEATVDVRIDVQEADRTTLGYGGGVEATIRARPTGPGGAAEDHIELAPRGEFEIGRRNLWGSNRSVNLFTRVSLRSTDVLQTDTDPGGNGQETESNPGFNEYRVIGTFREPRLFFSDRAELVVTGIVEQAIRTTFNFSRRIARGEVVTRMTPALTVTSRYSFEKTKLFDEIFPENEKPVLIDKLFPEVRLSKLAGSFIYDTRDELLDPSSGHTFILDTDLALRGLGSEVGFVRTFAQGFFYRQLPTSRRMVVALGGRVGVARGFERIKDGVAVRDLPASERFFAGGDTTVRGFSLDRLGNEETISDTGFPLGGNSVVILNGELRAKLIGRLQGVGFIDAGNVFPLASDLNVTDVRPAAGFGVRINTDFGPIRFDLGFNLDPKEFAGVTERRTVFHISIGQAF